MPSRAELELRAAPLDIDVATYKNDSKLEQAVIYAEQAMTVQVDAVTRAPSADSIAKVSGGANV